MVEIFFEVADFRDFGLIYRRYLECASSRTVQYNDNHVIRAVKFMNSDKGANSLTSVSI